MKTLNNDFIATVQAQGKRYQKVGKITALEIREPVRVETREGTLPNVAAGCFIATDGISIWPIAPDFMALHYREVAP